MSLFWNNFRSKGNRMYLEEVEEKETRTSKKEYRRKHRWGISGYPRLGRGRRRGRQATVGEGRSGGALVMMRMLVRMTMRKNFDSNSRDEANERRMAKKETRVATVVGRGEG